MLTEEQTMIRDMARAFAAEQLAPYAGEWDRTHAFPADAIRQMGELGLLGMLVPEEWGGAGRRPRRLRAGDRRGGGRRRRLLDDHERAQLGRLHADPEVRQRAAEGALPAADGAGRAARRLRA